MGVATQEQVDALFNIGGRRLTGNEYVVQVDKALDTNVRNILDRLGIDLVAKLEELVPKSSNKLASSISVIGITEKAGAYRLEIGFGDATYNDYIDKGVRGIVNKRKTYPNFEGHYYQFQTYGMPSEALKGLEGWVKRKNIELQATNKIENAESNSKRRKKLKQITSPASRLAYYIKKYGIEGRNFKKKSVDAVLPKYEAQLIEVSKNSLVLNVTKK